MNQYDFTNDWFATVQPNFTTYLQSMTGKVVNFLEVGAFEGRSTTWCLDNVLTNEASTMTVIDTWKGSPEHSPFDMDEVRARFYYNIEQTGKKDQVIVLENSSSVGLRWLKQQLTDNHYLKVIGHYDFAYIDGSHRASDVFDDALVALELVKPGGIMILDDYQWTEPIADFEKPALGIDAFLAVRYGRLEVLAKNYQVIVRVR